MKLRVADNDRFVKDSRNFAILNTDRSVLREHERKLEQLNRQKAQEEEINNIKNDVAEIKAMIAQLLESK